MPIPKYITHPLLLLSAGFAVGALVWVALPSEKTLKNVAEAQKTLVSNPDDFVCIQEFTQEACLVVATSPETAFCLDAPTLKNLESTSHEKMQLFFKGKCLEKKNLPQPNQKLPLSLWDASCFDGQDSASKAGLCPMTLLP